MKTYLYHLFTHLKNGQLARRLYIYSQNKKSCWIFLKVLWDNGFIIGYTQSLKNKNNLKIFLKYGKNNYPVIKNFKLLSKPGRRIYYSSVDIRKIKAHKYFIIFSTSHGLQSVVECKKKKIGGEPLIKIS